MLGTNPLVGRNEMADLTPNDHSLVITSIFATLQGEGPLSGQRSLFVRLAHCNLACSFCDTYFSTGTTFSFAELDTKMRSVVWSWLLVNNPSYYNASEEPHPDVLRGWNLVVTGGEPLLQKNLFEWLMALEEDNTFAQVQIETNGIFAVPADLYSDAIFVVSPKCVESNGVPLRHLKPHRTTLARANCLKFVISADLNSPYSAIPDWALAWKKTTGRPIYVSPMNEYLREPRSELIAAKSDRTIPLDVRSEVLERISFWEEGLLDMEANRKNHEYAALVAMRHDAILSLQIHLLVSLP